MHVFGVIIRFYFLESYGDEQNECSPLAPVR